MFIIKYDIRLPIIIVLHMHLNAISIFEYHLRLHIIGGYKVAAEIYEFHIICLNKNNLHHSNRPIKIVFYFLAIGIAFFCC